MIQRIRFRLFPALLVSVLALADPASAQWSRDSMVNTRIRDSITMQATDPKVATAPNGNTFICWANSQPGGFVTRLQLVDTNGYRLWDTAGILITDSMGSATFRYDMKADLNGNVIIATQDERSGGNMPVVFKVDQSGNMLWGADGIQLTDTAATSGLSPVIGITEDNNVLVAWNASGALTFVSVKKFAPDGTSLWNDNLRVIDRSGSKKKYERPQIVISSGEEFLLQYVERTGFGLGVSTMYAQRYNGTGAPVWSAPVKVSDGTIGFAHFPAPIPDGYGGFIVNFTTGNPAAISMNDAFVQRVYADGHTWGTSGVQLEASTVTHKFEAGIAYVPSENSYFASYRTTNSAQSTASINLQKLDTAGNLLFTNLAQTEVVPMSGSTNAEILYTSAMRNTDTGLVFIYYNGSAPEPILLRAIKVNYNGIATWPSPVMVSGVHSDKMKFVTGDFRYNQLVVAWTDARQTDGGIYAQNIQFGGRLGIICPAVTLAPFAHVCLTDSAFTLSGGSPGGGVYSGTGVTNGIFDPSVAGKGSFTIKYVHTLEDCIDSAVQTIVVEDCPNGIDRISGEKLFTCYPNPARDQFTIEMNTESAGPVTVRISGIDGRVIFSGYEQANGRYRKTFNLTEYPRGLYLVTVSTAGKTASVKMVLQ